MLWGSEAYVRELFEGTAVDLEFRRAEVMMNAPSEADAVELYTTKFGPVTGTRQATEADGRWPALRDALTSFFERHSTRDDRLAWPAEYLVVTGRAAPEGLIEAADTVSEVGMVKHAFKAGIKAMPGMEF